MYCHRSFLACARIDVLQHPHSYHVACRSMPSQRGVLCVPLLPFNVTLSVYLRQSMPHRVLHLAGLHNGRIWHYQTLLVYVCLTNRHNQPPCLRMPYEISVSTSLLWLGTAEPDWHPLLRAVCALLVSVSLTCGFAMLPCTT